MQKTIFQIIDSVTVYRVTVHPPGGSSLSAFILSIYVIHYRFGLYPLAVESLYNKFQT